MTGPKRILSLEDKSALVASTCVKIAWSYRGWFLAATVCAPHPWKHLQPEALQPLAGDPLGWQYARALRCPGLAAPGDMRVEDPRYTQPRHKWMPRKTQATQLHPIRKPSNRECFNSFLSIRNTSVTSKFADLNRMASLSQCP